MSLLRLLKHHIRVCLLKSINTNHALFSGCYKSISVLVIGDPVDGPEMSFHLRDFFLAFKIHYVDFVATLGDFGCFSGDDSAAHDEVEFFQFFNWVKHIRRKRTRLHRELTLKVPKHIQIPGIKHLRPIL